MSEKKKTILAIDDAPKNLFTISNILSEYFIVRFMQSRDLALSILSTDKTDLIILGIEAPLISERDFIDAVRRIPEAKDIPIICTSYGAPASMLSELKRIGVRDYISKPIISEPLKEKVFKALDMPEPK